MNKTIADCIKEMEENPSYAYPSKKWCIEIASKLPFSTLDELFTNAEAIGEYCKNIIIPTITL